VDRQIDTYFRVSRGRLKLREGIIENALIYYERADQRSSKHCKAVLFKCPDPKMMKKILTAVCSVLTVVDKRREIYFIGNVKFHIDRVKGLGNFFEIEAQGRSRKSGTAKLRAQCEFYQKALGIPKEDLIADSYSDRILKSARRGKEKPRRKAKSGNPALSF